MTHTVITRHTTHEISMLLLNFKLGEIVISTHRWQISRIRVFLNKIYKNRPVTNQIFRIRRETDIADTWLKLFTGVNKWKLDTHVWTWWHHMDHSCLHSNTYVRIIHHIKWQSINHLQVQQATTAVSYTIKSHRRKQHWGNSIFCLFVRWFL